MQDVYINPQRKPSRIRPIKAWQHMQKLIADKEDTEQVFHIIEALNGRALQRNLNAFLKSEAGRNQLRKKEYLPPILDDHAWIKSLPEGTVGRAYGDFMEREGLSAQGLVEESERMSAHYTRYQDDIEWYGHRMRDTHDLFHVLTGYGRDALGEAALLGFTYSQNPGRGIIFIAYMGARQLRRRLPKAARVMDCLWEGKRNGNIAQKIAREDVQALLREPLQAARQRLKIRPPLAYRQAIAVCVACGIELKQVAPAA